MKTQNIEIRLLIALAMLLGGAFSSSTLRAQAPSVAPAAHFTERQTTENQAEIETITNLLNRQGDAWNAGNLEAFMEAYWKSEQLTFSSGGGTTRGWQATLDRYKKGYAPPKEMGKLKFGMPEITLFENKTAMVLGTWHLTFSDKKIREGNFSLVMHKLDGKWVIIHDHSSEKKPEEKKSEEKPKPNADPGKDIPSATIEDSEK